MLHISPERLAALIDETATPDEASHLAACATCADELSAHRRLIRLALGESAREGAPLNDWASLGAMLKSEGIMASAPTVATHLSHGQRAVRLAAGFALVAGSALVGRWSSGVSFTPRQQTATPVAAAPAFASPQDAMHILTVAQQQYSDAATYLAAQDTTSHFIGLNVNTYRARRSALDNIVASTRAALYQAPQDPVLNQYYLSAIAAREATLRQYQAALPAKQALERY